MLHQSAIEGYFAQQEDLLVEAVSRLVRIDSTCLLYTSDAADE